MTAEPITRQQIAELAGVCVYKVNCVANRVDLKFPAPVGKQRQQLLYDRAEIDAWLVKNPLKKMSVSFMRNGTDPIEHRTRLNATRPKLDLALANAFLRGACAPLCVKKENARRRRRAQCNPPKTVLVHVQETENVAETPRPALAIERAPEGETFASRSGNTRQLFF
ncbi:MAG: hypothetical protein M8364_16690 [Methylobacter sp.]|uniref:hypothetical protein n=1 Tax=Methylobacter sp. TaxID=2051955 RepID=UPI00258A2A85|nr:hypothetical protein [Methylobacter sp.]MCL7422530.1 hypothetical protein [Methylobacter sp.]